MKSLGCVVPVPQDATSWYRAYGPLRYCRDVELIALDPRSVEWSDLQRVDAVFFQRPAIAADVYLPVFDMLKSLSIPWWVDFDDLLTDVPGWNPTASKFNSEASQKVITAAIAGARVVTVSTELLATRLNEHHPNIDPNLVVIPNAWMPGLRFAPRQQPTDYLKLVWRGGHSHAFDLCVGAEFFLNLPEHCQMTFMGHCPDFLGMAPEGKIRVMQDHQSPPDFLRSFIAEQPDFVLVPLVDCDFNRCKSEIAYLEATVAGALTIAPAWEPWISMPGCLCYDPDKPFAPQAMRLIEQYRNPDDRMVLVRKAQKYVVKERKASGRVAEQRRAIIEDLCNG